MFFNFTWGFLSHSTQAGLRTRVWVAADNGEQIADLPREWEQRATVQRRTKTAARRTFMMLDRQAGVCGQSWGGAWELTAACLLLGCELSSLLFLDVLGRGNIKVRGMYGGILSVVVSCKFTTQCCLWLPEELREHIAHSSVTNLLVACEEGVSPDGPEAGTAQGSALAVSFPCDRFLSEVSDQSILP